MTYSETPFSQLSDELWHVFGGRPMFPTTRDHCLVPAHHATVTICVEQRSYKLIMHVSENVLANV